MRRKEVVADHTFVCPPRTLGCSQRPEKNRTDLTSSYAISDYLSEMCVFYSHALETTECRYSLSPSLSHTHTYLCKGYCNFAPHYSGEAQFLFVR